MSTEHTPATTQTTEAPVSTKVTYTDEQQAHMQSLIDAAVGRAASRVRQEADQKVATLQAELEAARTKSTQHPPKSEGDPSDVAALKAALEDAKRFTQQSKLELEAARSAATLREREVQVARQEAISVRKEVEISKAASKIPFYDLNTVVKLTGDQIQFDEDRGTFVVRGDNGQIRLDNTLEKPLSIEAYLTDFAAKNKYLVRADIRSGTGSSESQRTGLDKAGRFEVADVFGPKSDSRKASQLMKDDPQEYRRMRALAKDAGLVA